MAKFVENTESDIVCPQCNPPRKLIVKTNRHNDNQFLGCPNYPECNYTRGIPEAWKMRANGQPSLFDVLSAPNIYHLYGESEAAAKRFRVAVTNAAKEISASQYEAGVCQCTENLFAVNPDGKCAGCKLPRIDNAE